MLLCEKDIPLYLHSRPYLQALLCEGPIPESGIEIPDGCLKKDLTISTHQDLTELLHTLRFWLLPELLHSSDELLRFEFSPANESHVVSCGEGFRNEFPSLFEISQILQREPQRRVEQAAHASDHILS